MCIRMKCYDLPVNVDILRPAGHRHILAPIPAGVIQGIENLYVDGFQFSAGHKKIDDDITLTFT